MFDKHGMLGGHLIKVGTGQHPAIAHLGLVIPEGNTPVPAGLTTNSRKGPFRVGHRATLSGLVIGAEQTAASASGAGDSARR